MPTTASHAWNLADRLVRITYPSGRVVDDALDSQGRVAGVTTKQNVGASAITVASSFTYKPFGPLAGLTYGNGAVRVQAGGLDRGGAGNYDQ